MFWQHTRKKDIFTLRIDISIVQLNAEGG